jgi:hypothetical protein
MSQDRPGKEPDEEDVERAQRLSQGRRGRSRRNQSSQSSQTDQTEQAKQTDDSDEGASSSQMSQPAETEQTEQMEQTEEESVPAETPLKERTHATYYLLDALTEDVDIRLDELNLELKRDHGPEATLEKNRHWRPLLIDLGLEAVAEMDPDEVRERLDETDRLDDAPRSEE